MSDDIYEDLKRCAERVAHSLTWAGITERVFEDEYTDDDITRDDDGFWYDADGDEMTDDEAFHAMQPYETPAQVWLEGQLEVRKVGYADLYGDTMTTVERVEVLISWGGPNIWADFCELPDDRVRIRCYWGGEEYTLYCADEIGVGDYFDEVINSGC